MHISLRQHHLIDRLPWALAGPLKKRFKPPLGYYFVVSRAPLIILIPEDFYDEMPRWGPFFEALKGKAAHFLCLIRCAPERYPEKYLRQFLSVIDSHQIHYPKHSFTLLANNLAQQRLFAGAGINSAFVNHNAFVDETLFQVGACASKRYDAIYNGVAAPYKRHELARLVPRLAIVTYLQPKHLEYFSLLARNMPTAEWLNFKSNPPSASDYQPIPQHKLSATLGQGKVGLCLSAAEGAMVASIEYLLCGLPIVSTPSLGGRDVFFDDDFVEIVEPTQEAVRDGVSRMTARNVDPDYIRARTLERIEQHRNVFVDLVQNICEKNGSCRDSKDLYTSLFPKPIYKLRPLHEIFLV